MAKASVGAVRIIDASGDACDDDGGALKVVLQGSEAINIGAVEIKDQNSETRAEVNADGELLVTAPPATFSGVATSIVDTVDSTAWTTFPNVGGKEVMITSHPNNVDDFEISGDGDEAAGLILKPTDALSLPINNTNLLEYRKVAHTTINQYLLIIVLS